MRSCTSHVCSLSFGVSLSAGRDLKDYHPILHRDFVYSESQRVNFGYMNLHTLDVDADKAEVHLPSPRYITS